MQRFYKLNESRRFIISFNHLCRLRVYKERFALCCFYLHKVIAVYREFQSIYICIFQSPQRLSKRSPFKLIAFVRQRLVVYRLPCQYSPRKCPQQDKQACNQRKY